MSFSIKNLSVGNRLYFSVLTVFLAFTVAFIVFQQIREKQYKAAVLALKLQDYNERMAEAIGYVHDFSEDAIDRYVRLHSIPGMRVTLIDRHGHVIYDNKMKDYRKLSNHISRPEVEKAIKRGSGSAVDRNSVTMNGEYFYSATFFKRDSIVIRSALPYDNNLSKSLCADQHYLWFALTAIIILTVILYRFTSRLGDYITKLRAFATRADNNESLDTIELINFPNDELGEIAERIIKIYKRLQTTRREQDIIKRQLTQNIAHELKTPVASIQGYLETIIENPGMSEATRQQFLQRSFAQSRRLTSLLQDISTLNRMDDAPELISQGEVDISKTVENIIKETSLQLQEHRMTFINKLQPDIKVKGNYSLLYSVFRNLTDNAIAYAGEGTTITLTGKHSEGKWHFTFSDNGVGVPSEHLPRLFERFYRVDKGRSRKMGGTGLGLAIVKNAIILHGGTISVHNNLTGGLRFEFYING